MQKMIIITGPTGAGKSALAVSLALAVGGEIINCDSRQVYREMNVGVSKPSARLMQKVPHHGYGIVSIRDPWHGGLFEEVTQRLIEDVASRGKVPIVTGGTALYIRFLIYGICDAPETSSTVRELFQTRLKAEGAQILHAELKLIDPISFEKIGPADAVRITRAHEVFKETGIPLSQWQSKHGFAKAKYDFLKIGLNLPRELLYSKIDARVLGMMEEGLESEAVSLINQWPQNQVLAKSIGYAEWLGLLAGTRTRADVVALIQQNTRNFAKRQMTWFRKDSDLKWFEPSQEDGVTRCAQEYLKN